MPFAESAPASPPHSPISSCEMGRGPKARPPNLQPPLPTHTGRYVSVLASSPDLRAPINSRPYGFQMWLLADVCPTHRSIWHAKGFGVTFWEFVRFLSDSDYQSSSGGLVFSPEVKLRPGVAAICS